MIYTDELYKQPDPPSTIAHEQPCHDPGVKLSTLRADAEEQEAQLKRPPPANPTLPPPAPRAPPRACSKAVGEIKARAADA